MSDHRIVFCTCPDHDTAEQLAEKILQDRLAACVNLVPGLTSLYIWKGNLTRGTEVLLMIKTTNAVYQQLEQTLQTLHPYELPEIISVPIEAGLDGYLGWITENCTATL